MTAATDRTDHTHLPRVALVTGATSGIGRSTAQLLAERGFITYGTVRSESAALPESVRALFMDVRELASVQAGVATIARNHGRIDVLVNNAGVTLIGALEESSLEQVQTLFDVNLFGALRLVQAVLPLMRRQRRGRIVHVSSLLGVVPGPFMAAYCASKHALEGMSESLDHELRPFGIRSTLVEPGFTRTLIYRDESRACAALPDYAPWRSSVEAWMSERVAAGDDPTLVAQAVLRAVNARRPAVREAVGLGPRWLARLRGWVPERVFGAGLRTHFRLSSGS